MHPLGSFKMESDQSGVTLCNVVSTPGHSPVPVCVPHMARAHLSLSLSHRAGVGAGVTPPTFRGSDTRSRLPLGSVIFRTRSGQQAETVMITIMVRMTFGIK